VECIVCDQVAGRWAVPGGIIHESGHWIVDHCIGPLGVGTLIVKPKRHVVHVWKLGAEEAAELGPLLRRTAAVVAELTDPAQIYVCMWSHREGVPRHVHFVVQPVTEEQHRRQGVGPRLQVAMFDAGITPPESEVREFADRARTLFG
jgi:diadenosine tetraphosphate (Ap4A) HIT family hydrolase